MIALKANTILLLLTIFMTTIDNVSFGHALIHLRVPRKLVHIMLFSIRYLEVIGREWRKLTTAMKVRCFHARLNWHTLQSYGYLIGMLLVRSLDRSDRVYAAMKCRGFRGDFYILDHFVMKKADVIFVVLGSVLLAGFSIWEITCRVS
jgi:cobalt/nickel transport system permease protein